MQTRDFKKEIAQYFRFGANVSLLRSRVELGEDQMLQTTKSRALYGQAPYVVNVSAGYVNPTIIEANLLWACGFVPRVDRRPSASGEWKTSRTGKTGSALRSRSPPRRGGCRGAGNG